MPFLLGARDFSYKGINYTVTDEENKYCETKCGYREEIRDPFLHYRYISGNDAVGPLIIPSVVSDGESDYYVTSIGAYSFCDNEITDISLPLSLKSIGFEAFRDCNDVNELLVPPSVENIDFLCFDTNFIKLAIPDRFHSTIGRYAKYLITYPSNDAIVDDGILYSISKDGLYYVPTSIEKFTLPESINSINDYAFAGCSKIQEIEINEPVYYVGEGAFMDCTYLRAISITQSLTAISNRLFENCIHLQNITLGNNVKSIGSASFSGCSELYEIEIPNSVTNIKYGAFQNCSKLSKVVISTNIEDLGNDIFSGCDSLREIIYLSYNPISAKEWMFNSDVYQDAELVIPEGTIQLYESTVPWNLFSNIREVNDAGIESICLPNSKILYDLNGCIFNNKYPSENKIVIVRDGNKTFKSLSRSIP